MEGNSCQQFSASFTETRLEDVDISKPLHTSPCLYGRRKSKPRLTSELRKQQYNVTLFDCNHSLANVINSFLANEKIYVLLYSFSFVLF